ncbi:MAG: proline dehydrogenase family protein, partial [Cyclobacteriaceae bacterium]|nr:proline dehydrogenase family protein [Cyclobacteriaceae bacterium]
MDFTDLATAFQYKSTSELKKASFLFSVINNPFLSWVLTQITRFGLYFHLPIKGAIRKTVFSHFCGGESIQDCRTTIDKLGNYQVRTILDFSVEGESTEAGFESTKSEILKIIRESAGAEHIPFTVFKMTGVASIELLKKVQSGRTLLPLEQEAFERIRSRVDIICGEAVAHNIPIMIDAEETWIQN